MSYLEQRRSWKQFGKPKEEKTFKRIAPKSQKKILREQQERESGRDTRMDKWFIEGREVMTGVCLFCGGKTEKENDVTYRNSEAHLFPKRKNMFPSIALHPENRIELCFFGNSCHTNFDNHIITFEDVKNNFPEAWKEIIRKTSILYPAMTEKEKNKVPQILLNEINNQS